MTQDDNAKGTPVKSVPASAEKTPAKVNHFIQLTNWLKLHYGSATDEKATAHKNKRMLWLTYVKCVAIGNIRMLCCRYILTTDRCIGETDSPMLI